MPEGHTIHRQAREHQARFAGAVLSATSPQGRFADGAALLDGRRLDIADAHGKHLFLGFTGDLWLHVHLGLYGTWTFGDGLAPPPRGALRLRLEGNGSYADLRGATACEVWTDAEKAGLESRLGPDPLRPRAAASRAWARLSASRTAVGQLLMDQAVVAGVGNVYRAEVLFRAGISPHRPGRSVTQAEFDGVWTDLVRLMRAGLRAGRIVTTRPADRRRSGRVRTQDAHYVYRRAGLPCRVCGTPVATELMATRNLFWCPACQAA
ncbi:MAG TPA: DNA-formamidopyrimidine glycosylase family protein [Actinomycetes bacterium]|nr:DNA-formamidopyrimidine glycosylase family protein [Actinomycetes bacterium]